MSEPARWSLRDVTGFFLGTFPTEAAAKTYADTCGVPRALVTPLYEHPPVQPEQTPIERIAGALERIADYFEGIKIDGC